jgi:hypothetical protein
MSEVVAPPFPLAGPSAKLTPHHGIGRSNDPRYGVVAGHLAKHQDSPGILIVANGAGRSSPRIFRDAVGNVLEFDLDDLVHTAVAVFRYHPHINNVLTHICDGKWERIGQALHIILNPLATLNDLSPLAQNIVELMCAERSVTGRILKPYFHALLAKVLPPRTAAYLRIHVFGLLLEMQARGAYLSQAAGGPGNRMVVEGGA